MRNRQQTREGYFSNMTTENYMDRTEGFDESPLTQLVQYRAGVIPWGTYE